MHSKTNIISKRTIPILLAVNFALFLAYFIPYYVITPKSDSLVAIQFIVTYLQEILLFAIPPIAATGLLIYSMENEAKKSLIKAIFITLTTFVYTIPFYYLKGIESGFDSIESLLFLIPTAALYAVIFYAQTVCFTFVGRFIMVNSLAKELSASSDHFGNAAKKASFSEKCKLVAPYIPEQMIPHRAFDLSPCLNLSIFLITAFEFIIYLATELINVTEYFIEYQGNYLGSEVFYIAFRFIFLLTLLFLTYAICISIKNRHLKSDVDD